MEIISILLVIIIILGVGDLIVGVSNDAANFTNSAIASKVASIRTIMIVVSFGVLLGALSSSGLMEIARKGIFKPEFFTLNELFILCLAVMLSDILLLDLYNTFGLPTSTTVSLVFELLGAALVLAVLKSNSEVGTFDMINSASALKIISGIFLSVLVAFFSGMILQFLFRLFFSYELDKSMRKFGGVFAGICFAVIATFIIVKGLKKSELIPVELTSYTQENLGLIILLNFIVWSVVFQVLVFLKVNVFKIVILAGTGALAMAFAGNDLVNFIGVPIAAVNGYDLIQSNGGDGTALGTELAGKIPASNLYLIIAGLIMVVTLWMSRKARSVQQTEISLGSQNEKIEVFQSNQVARVLVQGALRIWETVRVFIPGFVRDRVNARFQTKEFISGVTRTDYDYLRASVNIMTASSIIMGGTLMKLPLSTTFITFMVAMGTSFADRAWGRDNAVARVSGVMTVVGGWFMTAMVAMTVAGLIALIIYSTHMAMGIVLFCIIVFVVYKLTGIHRERQDDYEQRARRLELLQSDPKSGVAQLLEQLSGNITHLNDTLDLLMSAVKNGKRKPLAKAEKQIEALVREYHHNFFRAISFATKEQSKKELMALHHITSIQTDMRHVVGSLKRINGASRNLVDIYHTKLSKSEADDLDELLLMTADISAANRKALSGNKPGSSISKKAAQLAKQSHKRRTEINIAQGKRIKEGKSKIKSSIYYLMIVDELVDIIQKLAENLSSLSQLAPKNKPAREKTGKPKPKTGPNGKSRPKTKPGKRKAVR